MAARVSRQDVAVAALLAIVTAIVYFPVVLQGRVFASFDTLVYFYPNAFYLAERLRAGQLPLWDPYVFAGVPFLANSQVGALYPPNWLYLVGPVSTVYGWLIVAHVWLLAAGIYLAGRFNLALSRVAATYAAVAVAFGGFVGGMSGHLNQLEAFAWLPLAVVLVERAAAHRSLPLAVVASIPFALCALAGHSQILYIAGVAAVLTGGARAIQLSGSFAAAGRRLGLVAVGPVLGALLAAVQLVPTVELTSQSIRSTGLTFADAAAFSLPPPDLLVSLLPTIGQLPPSSEWLGFTGVTAVVFAGFGLWRRRSPEAYWLAVLALLGLVLAAGQFTPIYHAAFDLIPGFRLFRVPARWLSLWTVGVALLGGWGLDAACYCHLPSRGSPTRAIAVRIGLVVVGGGVLAVAYHFRHLIVWPSLATLGLWLGTGGLGLASLYVARRRPVIGKVAALAVLAVELAVASFWLPQQEAIWPDAVESPRSTIDYLIAQASPDRVLAIGDNSYDPGDLADIRRRLGDSLPPPARDAYITALKHVEGLTPNLALRFGLRTIDGYDGGILPLARYDLLKQLFARQGPDIADGRLRLQLRAAPEPALLGWLDVRYLMLDRLRDRWIAGTYFDLGISQQLAPGTPIRLPVSPPFPATTIGIALRGVDGDPPPGELAVRAGARSLSLDPTRTQADATPIDSDVDPTPIRLWRLALPEPTTADVVELTWRGDRPIVLRSVSLSDDRNGASQTVPVSPTYRLSLLGDMKIYENQETMSRAFLADGLDVVPDPSAVVARLRGPDWLPTTTAVASAGDVSPAAAFTTLGPPGDARIIVDRSEQVIVATSATDRRVLVLTDSAYPGWRATIDGRDSPILTVDLLFRGVIVPAGQHDVAFTYAPRSLAIGLAGTVIGLAIVLVVLVSATRRAVVLDAR